jgi:glutamate--cysteine ligase
VAGPPAKETTVTPLTEKDAERHVAARAFTPAHPGFVGLVLELPPAVAAVPPGRSRLRHGFLSAGPDRIAVSGPPSPGLDVAVERMREDLGAALLTRCDGAAVLRVNLEAGIAGDSAAGLRHRWAVAQAVTPVLVAAFANAPAPALRPAPGTHPRTAWAREVLDAAAGDGSFRELVRRGGTTIADLDRHVAAYRPAVAARGHLEISLEIRASHWQTAAAVATVLIEDAKAAAEALVALSDPEGTEATRSLFLSAYAALARRGAPRAVRDAVAAHLERFVLRDRPQPA